LSKNQSRNEEKKKRGGAVRNGWTEERATERGMKSEKFYFNVRYRYIFY